MLVNTINIFTYNYSVFAKEITGAFQVLINEVLSSYVLKRKAVLSLYYVTCTTSPIP